MATTSRTTANGRPGVSRHRVRQRIEERICNGNYAPGSRLVQQQLAEEFRVSQTVVREALFELASVGLISLDDHKGAYVTELSKEMLFQAYDVREMLEGLAVRQCCEHASRANIKELAALAEQIDRLGQEKRLSEMAQLDRTFHQYLISFSANEVLQRLTKVITVLSKALWIGEDADEIPRHHLDHMAVVTAIAENNPDEAERLIREHVRRGKARIKRAVEASHGGPQWIR